MKKAVLVLLLVMPFLVSAETDSKAGYVSQIDYTLEQPFGGFANVSSLGHYFTIVYQFALGIVGIIAVVLIMFGGLRWVAAAGNESIIGEAKEIITSAVVGLAIALLSYIILAFINPQFTTATLSIPQIVLTNDDSIIKLPACNSADFKGKTCIDTDTNASLNCEEVTCGHRALVDGAYCRGITCGDGEGGCYRGPVDPMTYACQNTYCGEWAQDCADKNYGNYTDAGTNFNSQFHSCACNYYTKVVMPLLGESVTQKSSTYIIADANGAETTPAENLHKLLCTEENDQEFYEGVMQEYGTTYGYTGSPSSALTRGWNCGFTSCGINAGFVASGGDTYRRCWVAGTGF